MAAQGEGAERSAVFSQRDSVHCVKPRGISPEGSLASFGEDPLWGMAG